MSVRQEIREADGLFFVTMTCYDWLNLFEITNGYNFVYKQFDILKKEGHFINGYVIMPNHLHALIAFVNKNININDRLGTMKRFMAYDIVKQLKQQNNFELLEQLKMGVNKTDAKRGKIHEVFEPSFDCKECYSINFIEQKLEYIHENPCKGKWKLVENPIEYVHSSARFYETGVQGIYPVMNYMDLENIDFTKGKLRDLSDQP